MRNSTPIMMSIAIVSLTTIAQYLLSDIVALSVYILYYPAIVFSCAYGHGPAAILLSMIGSQWLLHLDYSFTMSYKDAGGQAIFAICAYAVYRFGISRNDALDAAKEAIKTRDNFLFSASHELRTPLTTLKLRNQIRTRTLTKEGNSEEAMKLAEDLVVIDKIADLIHDMIDVSRIKAGRYVLNESDNIDLCELVTKVINTYDSQLGELGREITMDHRDKVIGTFDSLKIGQVVDNLITNAIKYGRGTIHVSIRGDKNAARLVIGDQGSGIPKEKKNIIFNRFERTDSGLGDSQSLGLGLYIAKEIVELHDGKIWLDDCEGAYFIVEIPLKRQIRMA